MRDLMRRLMALEQERSPVNCLDCAMDRLGAGSDVRAIEVCRHGPHRDWASVIRELDARLEQEMVPLE